MNITVVGLGLIGGSFARAVNEYTENNTVYGTDKDISTVLAAKLVGAIAAPGTDETLASSELVIISLYPSATVEFLEEKADVIKKGAVVFDTCGVKRSVCGRGYEIASEHGFHFIGGHPMAGTQYSGFSHSKAAMFSGASMLLCPDENEDIPTIERLREFLLALGFSQIHFTSPDEHDRMIAFTSQLAHVVSNAYVKSPQALTHKGFSAGSYKDLTRVARLNPQMWTELFLDNRDNLTAELDILIANLTGYSEALKNGDAEALLEKLDEGSKIKIQAEKN